MLFQAFTRAFLAKKRAEDARQVKAATTIQRVWRGSKERKAYTSIRNNIILFESVAKGFLCRRKLMETKLYNAAIIIQRTWRSQRAIRCWRQYRKKIVIVQNLQRGRVARRAYKKLREEARDLKQISYKLENKVVELTQSLGALKRENRSLVTQLENYESQLKSWRTRHNALESRSRELQGEANQAGITAARLAALEEEHNKLQASHAEHLGNAKRLQEEQRTLQESLRVSNSELEKARQANTSHEKEKTTLRQQINELSDQLEMAKRAPPPPPVTNGVNGDYQTGNTAQAPNGLINLVSSKKPKRR